MGVQPVWLRPLVARGGRCPGAESVVDTNRRLWDLNFDLSSALPFPHTVLVVSTFESLEGICGLAVVYPGRRPSAFHVRWLWGIRRDPVPVRQQLWRAVGSCGTKVLSEPYRSEILNLFAVPLY
eukprot:m51a1_g14671 hypothetical protein (124) ;mRNA; f:37946-38317